MTYDPSILPVRERILANLQTTLESVTGAPTYALKLEQVKRFGGNTQTKITDYPGCIIVPQEERTDDGRICIQEHWMPVDLLLVVRKETWRQDINKLLADVRVALLSDYTRGGLAVWTKTIAEDVYEPATTEPVASARMQIQIYYRTAFDDPTAPR